MNSAQVQHRLLCLTCSLPHQGQPWPHQCSLLAVAESPGNTIYVVTDTDVYRRAHVAHIVLTSMLLLLLSRFSRARLSATPEMAAHQAPPSLGFYRQEHWSGLPFPSPPLSQGDIILLKEKKGMRKARGLQMEEIGCKCQTFFSLC